MGNVTKMMAQNTISNVDMDLVLFTDNIDEAVEHVKYYIRQNYKMRKLKPLKLLLERFN